MKYCGFPRELPDVKTSLAVLKAGEARLLLSSHTSFTDQPSTRQLSIRTYGQEAWMCVAGLEEPEGLGQSPTSGGGGDNKARRNRLWGREGRGWGGRRYLNTIERGKNRRSPTCVQNSLSASSREENNGKVCSKELISLKCISVVGQNILFFFSLHHLHFALSSFTS